MLFLWVLCTCVITTQATTAIHADSNDQDSFLVNRLDSLELLVSQQQAQFQREREQWQTDINVLRAENQDLKKQVETLQHSDRLTHSLMEDNQSLKADLAVLQRELASMKKKQQYLEDVAAKWVKKTMVDTVVFDGPTGDDQFSQPQALTGEERPGQSRETTKDLKHSLHVSTRSDDHGPLEVVVSQITQRLTQVTADIQTLKNVNSQQDQHLQNMQQAQGSAFVHWGSSTCPDSSQVVYAGVMGGSYYTNDGAAANALCLSMSPILLNPHSGVSYTELYGGEYETYDSHMNKDPVCTMCRSPHSTTVMVPGTNVCSPGWTLQYSGFLMGGYHTHKAATQFICLDSALEGRVGSDDDHNGHLLYFIKTVCGSLPCPPYDNGKLVTCAVCSK